MAINVKYGPKTLTLIRGDTMTIAFNWPLEDVQFVAMNVAEQLQGHFVHHGRHFNAVDGGYADLEFFDYYNRLDPDRCALLRAQWKFIQAEVVS